MHIKDRIVIKLKMAVHYGVDALMGYPKEFTVYPDGEHVRIRHLGGVWELKPVYTYQQRALSFIKQNYRYGWHVVKAPVGYDRCIGVDNLSKEPGQAISNLLDGEALIERYRNSNFKA